MTESESGVLPLNDSPVGNVEEPCPSIFCPVYGRREYNAIDILCQQIFSIKLNLHHETAWALLKKTATLPEEGRRLHFGPMLL